MYNIYYINIIAIQDTLLIENVLDKSDKQKQLIEDKLDAEIIQVCNTITVFLKYNWHLNPIKNESVIDLGLQNIKKYCKCTA